jgi:glycosyltransferase involved in cell wall biosynthesis
MPVLYRGKAVLTLHEAEPFMPGTTIPRALLIWWRVMRLLSARRADLILTVSEAARQDLVRWMHLDVKRIHVVHLGVDAARFSERTLSRLAERLPRPYLLWAGRPYPRKNLLCLLDAFSQVRRAGYRERLVLLGPPGWQEIALRQRIRDEFAGGTVLRCPAEWSNLPAWYQGASVFVFPSIQETFGLPVLEAMASGTPVIAADIPALREVGGDAAVYVSPTSATALANAIQEVLSNGALRDEMREKGLARAAIFDWGTTVARTDQRLRVAACPPRSGARTDSR